jgi:tRNA A-37 threonylcarbamoyl transferase component Bud32
VGHFLEAVPAAHRDTAQAVLSGAFETAPLDAVVRLSGGASTAMLFRIEHRGRRYLLRIEGQASPLRNPEQYVSMRMAVDAGIAPRILYLDDARRAVVMDFVAEQPLETYPGGRAALLQAIGALIRRLQDGPVFPAFVAYPDIVTRLLTYVSQTGLFVDGLMAPHLARLAQIAAAWAPPALVSSHNDLNPRNILFDGERLWVIDWESAYRNDALADVAVVLDNMAPTPELEDVLLTAWLGRPPDAAVRARLALLRSLTRLYYAGGLLSGLMAHPREEPDGDLAVPTLAQFERAVRDGRLKPGSRAMLHTMGKMYLASFLSGGPVPPLCDAIAG